MLAVNPENHWTTVIFRLTTNPIHRTSRKINPPATFTGYWNNPAWTGPVISCKPNPVISKPAQMAQPSADPQGCFHIIKCSSLNDYFLAPLSPIEERSYSGIFPWRYVQRPYPNRYIAAPFLSLWYPEAEHHQYIRTFNLKGSLSAGQKESI